MCMIVKNEETMLPRCLDSIKDWVDEIVVVDTGSTDRTVAIAERYGATVYHHPWENDFSKHRNQSLSYATGDWILILDADEEIKNGHGPHIRQIVSDCQRDVTKIYFIVKDIKKKQTAMVSQSIRLFKNRVGVHYDGIVHNKIIAPSGESIKSGIILYHYGYDLPQEDMDRKFQRTYSLLEIQLHENPFDPFAHYNMATALENRNPEKSIEHGHKLISLLKEEKNAPRFYINIFFIMAASFARLKKIDKAIDICKEAIHLFPKYVDAYWILSECYFDKKDYSRVIQYGTRFFQHIGDFEDHPEELSELFVYSYDQKHKVSLRLGLSYIYADKWMEAIPHLIKYIQRQQSRSDAIQTILSHLKTHHSEYGRVEEWILPRIDPDASPQQSRNPTLSLCMIVKNEEKTLTRCLDSVKGFVDEIIIVDTGSSDKTADLAKSYGAQIYTHIWENDFSKHRNQSLQYASGDWILWLDADEELEPGGGDKIRKMIAETDADAISAVVVSFFDHQTKEAWNNSKKLLKNNGRIHFEGKVHNQVRGNRSNAFCPVKIYHYGYDLTPEQKREKFKRTSTLLEQRIREEPHDFRHHHDLAVCYQSMGKYNDALKEATLAIDMASTQKKQHWGVILWSCFVAASCSFNLGRIEAAEAYARRAMDVYPNYLDAHYVLSMIYHRRNDFKQFQFSFDAYIREWNRLKRHAHPNASIVYNTIGDAWRLYLARADLYLAEDNQKAAEDEFEDALAICPLRCACWRMMGLYYKTRSLWEKALACFENARADGLPEDRYLYETAMIQNDRAMPDAYRKNMEILETMDSQDPEILQELGNASLADKNYKKASYRFQQLLEMGVEDPNVYTNWAVACKELDSIDEAIELNRKAIAMKSDMPEALINLGHLYFDLNRHDEAQSCFLQALDLQPDAIDVYLRLGLISLFRGNVENCVEIATIILGILGKNVQLALNRMEDLALVYRMISQDVQAHGGSIISRDAARIASILNQGKVTVDSVIE